jgi:hypothetical protein
MHGARGARASDLPGSGSPMARDLVGKTVKNIPYDKGNAPDGRRLRKTDIRARELARDFLTRPDFCECPIYGRVEIYSTRLAPGNGSEAKFGKLLFGHSPLHCFDFILDPRKLIALELTDCRTLNALDEGAAPSARPMAAWARHQRTDSSSDASLGQHHDCRRSIRASCCRYCAQPCPCGAQRIKPDGN